VAKLSDIELRALSERARRVRQRVVEAVWEAGGGHIGGALSQADVLVTLYFRSLKIDPARPDWPERDRFVLGAACGALGLAAVLAERGLLGDDAFFDLARRGHALDRRSVPGVEISSGAPGQALGVAVGLAAGAKIKKETYRTVCLLSDTECYQGGTWEAALAAPALGVRRLVAIVDRSGLGKAGDTEDEAPLEPLAAKWRAFGWRAFACDGHDFQSLSGALGSALAGDRPSVVVAETVRGRGVSFMEDDPAWHWGSLDSEAYARALADVRGGKKRRLFGSRGGKG
jgi:transketolase